MWFLCGDQTDGFGSAVGRVGQAMIEQLPRGGWDSDDVDDFHGAAGIAGELTDADGEVVADGREPKQCDRHLAILATAAVSSLSP